MQAAKFHRTAIVVPGFGENGRSRAYVAVARCLRRAGWRVVLCVPKWSRRTADDWLAHVLLACRREARRGGKLAGFGFSAGAMALYRASGQVRFERLWLCSVSPFFAEDVPLLPPFVWKVLGARRKAAFQRAVPPTKPLVGRSWVAFGEGEWKLVAGRARRVARHLSGEMEAVPGAPHDIGHPSYLAAAEKAIKRR